MLMKKQGLLIAEALVAFATRQTPTDRSCPKFWFEQHPAFATDIRRKDHPPFWPGRHYAVHAVHPIRHESSAEPQYFHIGRGTFILFLTPQQFPYDKPASPSSASLRYKLYFPITKMIGTMQYSEQYGRPDSGVGFHRYVRAPSDRPRWSASYRNARVFCRCQLRPVIA